MSESSAKGFDCVQSMREARDGISAETDGMNYGEMMAWFRNHHYSDPVLQRLADEAAQRAESPNRAAAER